MYRVISLIFVKDVFLYTIDKHDVFLLFCYIKVLNIVHFIYQLSKGIAFIKYFIFLQILKYLLFLFFSGFDFKQLIILLFRQKLRIGQINLRVAFLRIFCRSKLYESVAIVEIAFGQYSTLKALRNVEFV